MKKKYESPSLEIVGGETNNTENEGGVGCGNRYSLPYGLCKEAGIDTTGMRPREAWKALEDKTGKTKEEFEKEHWGKTAKDSKEGSDNNSSQGIDKNNEAEYNKETNKNIKFNSPLPKIFINKMTEAKNSVPERERWRVDIHSSKDYNNDKLFTTEGGSCVAIEPNGNIISVCKRNGDTVYGRDLLRHAVENGGDRLDAFGGLWGFYIKNGFEPVSWTPFNEEYAPVGWNKEYDGAEPVIFWKFTGKINKIKYEDFLKDVKPSQDYDTAMRIRDKEIKK